jgi:non-canonical purine NTP pyrophosphatase (RdgB/HAM1 family)
MLYFITGSENKFKEAQSIISDMERVDIDLPEIQEVDAHKIIEEKLLAGLAKHAGPLVVEDTSLYLDCLGGLPGPLIKWFMKTIGNEGLVKIVQSFGNDGASAKTIIGLADSDAQISFFEGEVRGKIVPVRGNSSFGWDPIFLPDEHTATFAEMSPDEKNSLSMRRIAFQKLKDSLNTQ